MNGEDQHNSSMPAGSVGRGIAYMCLAVFFLVGLDVTARWLMQKYSLAQLIFVRSVISVALLIGFTAVRGQLADLRTRRIGWHVFRSLLMVGSMFSFFHALRFVPLADIVIYAFAAPLIVTALSRPILGEAVGPLRWAAVVAGFVGVLVVLRPGFGAAHPAAIYAVIGAAFYAGLALTARKLANTETTLSLSINLFAAPLVVAGVLCVPGWQWPDAFDWFMFAVCGVFGGLGIVLINAAYQRAPVAVIVPFEYTALIWAAAAGYVFWNEIPDIYAWCGAAIITSSGLFILYRETRSPPLSDVAQSSFPLQEAAVGQAGEPDAGSGDRAGPST
ncbi:MAG: DMT family transporter [Gammaproteobacteria bacterium]